MAEPQSNPTLIVPQLTPEESRRFWSKVDASAGADGCWLWTAAKSEKGYGIFGLRGKTYKAPRIAYREGYGSDPGPLHVCHNCPGGDNPACVNPTHLFLGTIQINNADMVRKGRHVPGGTRCGKNGKWRRGPEHPNTGRSTDYAPQGEAHPGAKLSGDDVRAIRERYAQGGISYVRLAAHYGVNQSAIAKIVTRKHWGHIV